MQISASLHNSLVILSAILFVCFLIFIGLKQLRQLWQQIHIIYKNRRNVLLLQSSELNELINVLSSVNDEIDVHPRQIRRILRQALDSNVVKDVATSKPDLHLLRPSMTKNEETRQYTLNFHHFEKEEKEDKNLCFEAYFGVPKTYIAQLKSIKHKSLKNKSSKSNKKNVFVQDEISQSPLNAMQSILAQTNLKRVYSNSVSQMNKLSMDEEFEKNNDEIEMQIMKIEQNEKKTFEGIELTEIRTKKEPNLNRITLQKIIPNAYVYKYEFMDCKNEQNINFDEDELESTINAIIGNQPTAMIKKRGKQTKFKKMATKNDEIEEDEMYFCVLISYIRYPQKSEENDEKCEEFEEEKDEMIGINENEQFEIVNVNGKNYKIECLEISIFEAPSAFCATNQIKKKSKEQTKELGASASDKDIENALDPSLCMQFLCDFKLQRLVEYYDIFGISSSDVERVNVNEKSLDCKICFDSPANVILLPCRHCCCCVECYKQIEVCPMCRKPIRQTLRWKTD